MTIIRVACPYCKRPSEFPPAPPPIRMWGPYPEGELPLMSIHPPAPWENATADERAHLPRDWYTCPACGWSWRPADGSHSVHWRDDYQRAGTVKLRLRARHYRLRIPPYEARATFTASPFVEPHRGHGVFDDLPHEAVERRLHGEIGQQRIYWQQHTWRRRWHDLRHWFRRRPWRVWRIRLAIAVKRIIVGRRPHAANTLNGGDADG